jgi:hypothetical protein
MNFPRGHFVENLENLKVKQLIRNINLNYIIIKSKVLQHFKINAITLSLRYDNFVMKILLTK